MFNVIKKQAIADFFTTLVSGKTKQRFKEVENGSRYQKRLNK